MTYAERYSNRLKNDFHKAVEILDDFTKAFCMDVDRMNEENDLIFMCDKCPFEDGGLCRVKTFRYNFATDYKDFGAMGDR